jgi:serine/threonine-protein kinase RsbT
MSSATSVPVHQEGDIISARQLGRELAVQAGFSGSDLTLIATAISEVARNIIVYAERGEILLEVIHREGRTGIAVVARDDGPGIVDIERAMRDGYSTGNSLGLGLPGAKRLMDEFDIVSIVGKGTTITMKKWAP